MTLEFEFKFKVTLELPKQYNTSFMLVVLQQKTIFLERPKILHGRRNYIDIDL